MPEIEFDLEIQQGLPGPANTLTIGSVSSGPTPSATITGSAPSQALNLVLAKGDAATIAVGTVSTGDAGSSAAVTNAGTSGSAVLNFTIPRGDKGETGEKGDKGDGATITLGTVTTGTAGSSASITNTGTTGDAVFNFTIPRGDKGEVGETGPVNTLTISSVTTGAAGSQASVTISGTAPNQSLSFSIPAGPEPSLTIADNANTAITLADTDNNKVIRCTASSAVTITVPSTLAAGFSCMVIQEGTGQVTFAQGSGATINSFGNLLKTAGQHAPASLMRVGAGIYNLSGNLV